MVAGSVMAADGSPFARQPVRLDDYSLAGGTRRLAKNLREGSIEAETDDDGRYFFSFPARDNLLGGEQGALRVHASAPPGNGAVSGAVVAASFPVRYESIRIPPLKLEDPGLAVEGTGAEVTANSSPARPGPFELAFEADDLGPLWQVTTAAERVALDPRILEDSSGRVVTRRQSVERAKDSDVRVTVESPGAPYLAGAGAPPSRRSPCRFLDGSRLTPLGDLVRDGIPRLDPGCSLTNGVLSGESWSLGTALIDLVDAVPAELVVVRGCMYTCPVEVSADGKTYQPGGSVSGPYGTIDLDGQPIRAVKVVASSSDSLKEVSVWGPRPPGPALKQLTLGQRDRLARRFGDDEGDGGGVPWGLGIVAMLLLATVLTGTGLAAVSRRRRR